MGNLLILDCGDRVALIDSFLIQKKRNLKIFAADCSNLAAGLYKADGYFILPPVDSIQYIRQLLEICKKNHISMILPLYDQDLLIIGKNRENIEMQNIRCMSSNYETILLCEDKLKLNIFLKENNYNTIATFQDSDCYIRNCGLFPAIIKPRNGRGSQGIVYIKDEMQLKEAQLNNCIIQSMIQGDEYGIDAFVDYFTHKVTAFFIKKKILMKNGETFKSISVKSEKIKYFLIPLIEKLKIIGPVDIDIIVCDGNIYVLDINPRFGGGVLHAIKCGVNIPKMILNNNEGIKNEYSEFYREGEIMLKYTEALLI